MRPKSEIYTPKRDDKHPHPFHKGSPLQGDDGKILLDARKPKNKPFYMTENTNINYLIATRQWQTFLYDRKYQHQLLDRNTPVSDTGVMRSTN